MKWFAKRLFTLPCNLDREKVGGSAVAGPLFFCFGASFFVLWWSDVFAGVFAHNACFGVVFLWSRCGDLRG
jgi:hypothetical protein